jgi:2-oxoglutarate ferredoxin oxidoreductase subunit delta
MALAVAEPAGPAIRSPLTISVDRCKGCELCIAACPSAVLAMDPGVVNRLGHHPVRLIDPAGCTSCARCARVCPDAVFRVFAAPRAARSAETHR